MNPRATAKFLLWLLPLALAPAAAQERPAFLNEALAVEIEADEAELSEERDVSIYRGDVVLRRGPLTMRGDQLKIVRQTAEGRIEATLSGNPATATHQLDASDEPVVASAQRIIYTTVLEILELSGQAKIRRGDDQLQGDTVRYDVANARIEADGGRERVRIIITPPASPSPE